MENQAKNYLIQSQNIPRNPKTGGPYFTICEDGWEDKWEVGDTMIFPPLTLWKRIKICMNKVFKRKKYHTVWEVVNKCQDSIVFEQKDINLED